MQNQMQAFSTWMVSQNTPSSSSGHVLCPPALESAPPGLYSSSGSQTPHVASVLAQGPSRCGDVAEENLPSGSFLHSSVVPPDLQVHPPPSLAGALEDVSPPPSLWGSVVPLDVSDMDNRHDPFEDSDLQGFSLALVGAALSVCLSTEGPSGQEALLWSMVWTGGDSKQKLRCIP